MYFFNGVEYQGVSPRVICGHILENEEKKYKSGGDGILHAGIDFFFISEFVIKNQTMSFTTTCNHGAIRKYTFIKDSTTEIWSGTWSWRNESGKVVCFLTKASDNFPKLVEQT